MKPSITDEEEYGHMRNEDKKILVVDDTRLMVAMITNFLKSANYQVISAGSGEDALEMVKKEMPDLILLDVVLPNMSGYEVCSILRSNLRYSLIPIIMLTGQTDEEEKLKGLELGADDYVVKPFNPRELLARVKNTLFRLERSRESNPMTGLRGNNDIESEISDRINKNIPFAVMYLDLNSFKPYNDIYGFPKGDIAIKMTANIIYDSVEEFGAQTDFIGHIGGDDFVTVVDPAGAIPIAESIIKNFEERKISLYNETDLSAGYITASDRSGVIKKFDLIGISIAIIFSDKDKIDSTMKLSEVAASLKSKAKKSGKSAYATSGD